MKHHNLLPIKVFEPVEGIARPRESWARSIVAVVIVAVIVCAMVLL